MVDVQSSLPHQLSVQTMQVNAHKMMIVKLLVICAVQAAVRAAENAKKALEVGIFHHRWQNW